MTEIDFVDVEARCPSEIFISTQISQRNVVTDITSRPASVDVVDSLDTSTRHLPEVTKALKLEDTRNQFPLISSTTADVGLQRRHKKGTRPRGCPCCDPSNVDNIIDKMIFLETPP